MTKISQQLKTDKRTKSTIKANPLKTKVQLIYNNMELSLSHVEAKRIGTILLKAVAIQESVKADSKKPHPPIFSEPEIYSHIDNCSAKHCLHCEACLKQKEFPINGFVYCSKCYKQVKHTLMKRPIPINDEIQSWINKLTNLFCLNHTPIVQLRGNKDQGQCNWYTTPIIISIGGKETISLKTLVHEFIHAMGRDHEWKIDGVHDFRSDNKLDTFSPLIVKDLTGKDELKIVL